MHVLCGSCKHGTDLQLDDYDKFNVVRISTSGLYEHTRDTS